MGGEGYAFCDTEFLFFRGNHWVDWDLCSLCTQDKKDEPLTSRGYQCKGRCSNDWENSENEAPRCEVKDRGDNDPATDYCTTCTNCTNVIVDDRPGSEVVNLPIGDVTNAAAGRYIMDDAGYF